MPRGDRTGPAGAGPTTGRMAGHCAGFPRPGFANPAYRGGGGFGGGGRGYRHMYYATSLPGWARFGSPPRWGWGDPVNVPEDAPLQPLSPEQKREYLENQARALKEHLKELEEEIDRLKEN